MAADNARHSVLPERDPTSQTSVGTAEFKPMKGGDWERIRLSVNLHRLLSWAYTGLAIIMVILQSGLGITTAALVGVQGGQAKNAVIALGAINGFIGAMSGALQYWGQPTRENHYYQSLAVVKGDVERLIGEFKNPYTVKDPYSEGDTVMAQYNQAMTDAESNKPTVWLQNTKPIPTGRV
jgi:SMODS and SLOG-associating 2TM effector domain